MGAGIVETLLALIRLGIDVAPYVARLKDAFSAGAVPPTDAQLDALRALEREMVNKILFPLPPETDRIT